jgi:hypothetical protein
MAVSFAFEPTRLEEAIKSRMACCMAKWLPPFIPEIQVFEPLKPEGFST